MNEEISIKNELMDSNKRLQEKIESLNHQLNSFQKYHHYVWYVKNYHYNKL